MTHIARLDSRALIRVSGPDARPFLNNLLTQSVEDMKPGELRFAALLSPPGRLLFDLFVWGEETALVLDVAADRREALLQRLTMYRLRTPVDISIPADAVFTAWNTDDDGPVPGFACDPRLPGLGGRRYSDQSEINADEADWTAHRMALGVPGAADWPDDKTYPIEANFDLLNGVDFHKGCFIGQETASRMKRRGAIKNRMMTLAFDGPPLPFGAEVLNGERRAGEVRSSVDVLAMALLRVDRLDGELTVEGRPVALRRPVYIPQEDAPDNAPDAS